MVVNQHQVVKPQKLAATALGVLEQELKVAGTFHKEGVDQFKGVENDTIFVKVPGVLPFREYGWRNDRSAEIVYDEYTERKIPVTFSGNFYNAVKITDEQNDFDINQWADLLTPQAKAVSRGIQRGAVKTLTGATYNVTIGGIEANLRSALIEARRVLNAFHVPEGERILMVGSQVAAALLGDEKLSLASNVGDGIAESVLVSATLGKRFGFTIIEDETIAPTDAYAYVRSAFIFANAAPSVPSSVMGATTSYEDVALRWVRDYDPGRMNERSVVNTYAGFRAVKDPLAYWDEAKKTEVITTTEHFVRGIKLTVGGTSAYPEPASELATATGINGNAAWQNGTVVDLVP